MSQLLTVRLAAKEAIAKDICTLTLVAADDGPLPTFTAGAHVDVHLPNGIVRQYSICNAPTETHHYVLAVLMQANSRGGSRGVHEQLAPGQLLQISAPRNHFPLDPRAARSLLIAGGIGITPILAMARALASSGGAFELHYAAGSLERMAFRADIAACDWAGAAHFHVGQTPLNVAQLLADQSEDVHVYVCGPQGLINSVIETAMRLGWADNRIHREFFSGTDTAAFDLNHAFEIELARSGRIITVQPDQTAAQALIAAGVPLLTSCEQGVCGTCLTRVLVGKPEHRDLYLTPEEQAANDQFTPCCSRALSPRLVLDLG
ncbi:PDR/VanB family oxidoreductase [Roseateles koreensis]|uniref:PDR/VanB family oxidoreductase n=1 Tax=Roseateles koreensis TaxID=2987526 RepID=A0ABT5KN96_9BURK|nr:PDR/VanB family oxidoreductase [Roseateles koreensis]MDC8784391.1 PDR/VanB family oxidoreductase [Roseateles koreensis]